MVSMPKVNLNLGFNFTQPTKFSRVAPISKVYRAPHLPFSPFLAIPAGITVAWLLSPAFSPEIKAEMVVRTKKFFLGK